jgi:hypothetical protein
VLVFIHINSFEFDLHVSKSETLEQLHLVCLEMEMVLSRPSVTIQVIDSVFKDIAVTTRCTSSPVLHFK